ncbi:proline-rich transmembrane protein 1-like [Halichondria panicea]|uniref:proline-rich transmembrane protein 1-like n=1 Tax=Halichondria panicea TaxID=6063 RepID=UPI00312BB381
MSEKQVESVPLSSKQEEAGGPPPVYPQQPVVYAQQPVVYVTQAQQAPPGGVPPKDYFVMSILTLLFCFWPLGIVALLKSIEVRSAVDRGDYAAAQTASKSALQLNKLAIIIGIIVLVFVLVLVGLSQLSWIIPFAVIRRN